MSETSSTHSRAVGKQRVKRSVAIMARLKRAGLAELVETIATRYGVELRDLLGRSHSKRAAAARHNAWYQTRYHSEIEWGYTDIARLFSVDHTTVMFGVRQHAAQLEASRVRWAPARCACTGENARCA